ncbi:MAG TPA: cupin domain-containing protein [Candidatus Binatia bacterium]
MEAKAEESRAQALADFDREIEKYSIQGHWKMELPANMEPRSKLKPMLWKGSMIREQLMRAGDLIGVDEAGRRTIQLVNPGVAPRKFTTHTLQMSIQVVLPGEIATAHRHTMAAIRFVVEGKDTFTTVNGDKFLMEPGDLILTPNWTWHDHINASDGPMIWIDGLDVPFSQAMDVMFIEDHEKPQQTVQRVWKNSDDGKGHSGGSPWYYKWQDSEKSLRQMVERSGQSSGDLILDYEGEGGGPTLPTIGCGLHLLRQGERTRSRRRTSSGIFHVVRGRGRTVVKDEVLVWEKGDYFVVPNWAWHRHENRSLDEEACLFFMSDRPLLEPFGLYREEFQG